MWLPSENQGKRWSAQQLVQSTLSSKNSYLFVSILNPIMVTSSKPAHHLFAFNIEEFESFMLIILVLEGFWSPQKFSRIYYYGP